MVTHSRPSPPTIPASPGSKGSFDVRTPASLVPGNPGRCRLIWNGRAQRRTRPAVRRHPRRGRVRRTRPPARADGAGDVPPRPPPRRPYCRRRLPGGVPGAGHEGRGHLAAGARRCVAARGGGPRRAEGPGVGAEARPDGPGRRRRVRRAPRRPDAADVRAHRRRARRCRSTARGRALRPRTAVAPRSGRGTQERGRCRAGWRGQEAPGRPAHPARRDGPAAGVGVLLPASAAGDCAAQLAASTTAPRAGRGRGGRRGRGPRAGRRTHAGGSRAHHHLHTARRRRRRAGAGRRRPLRAGLCRPAEAARRAAPSRGRRARPGRERLGDEAHVHPRGSGHGGRGRAGPSRVRRRGRVARLLGCEDRQAEGAVPRSPAAHRSQQADQLRPVLHGRSARPRGHRGELGPPDSDQGNQHVLRSARPRGLDDGRGD